MEIKIKGKYHKVGKAFKYVETYDKLYHAIITNIYKKGSKLPGEIQLSKELNVSRVTLRQSLSLLEEDGYVTTVQGVGTFVNTEFNNERVSLDSSINPIYTTISTYPTSLETRFNIEPPSDFIKHSLKIDDELIIISDRWYRDINDKILAYSLTFTALNLILENNIDLNDINQFINFLEIDIYKNSTNKKYHFMTTKTGNFVSNRYQLSEENKFIILVETIFQDEKVLSYTKHYIPIDNFNLNLNY